ncbi:MAG: hypothetical protein M1490_05365 [Candidatus Bathyarchaeota archaeon]|nr:hypothetical protein [Candidatus Bathyarchaeota archaeon]
MSLKQKNLDKIRSELQKGWVLAKCKKCGCMKEALENLRLALPSIQSDTSADLLTRIENWLKEVEQTKYSCLGCEHCFPAEATNLFNEAFPETANLPSSSCNFEIKENVWPPVPGEYNVIYDNADCSVSVSTLASEDLVENLARLKPKGLCIVGKTETENIGIDKVIKNTITNPAIRFLILAGADPQGHQSGKTLLALSKNGVDENMRVIKSPAIKPILKNVTLEEVETFRQQITLVDMIGCEDPAKIAEKINSISLTSNSCKECLPPTKIASAMTVPVIFAEKCSKVEVDKAGYFVIIPQQPDRITVEHYSYDNKLLRYIEGKDAETLYSTIVCNGWVTQLSHAAYVGMELEKAEMSLKLGFRYVQDKAQYPIKNTAKRRKKI